MTLARKSVVVGVLVLGIAAAATSPALATRHTTELPTEHRIAGVTDDSRHTTGVPDDSRHTT